MPRRCIERFAVFDQNTEGAFGLKVDRVLMRLVDTLAPNPATGARAMR